MFIFLDTEITGTGPDVRLCQIAFKLEISNNSVLIPRISIGKHKGMRNLSMKMRHRFAEIRLHHFV